MAADFPKPFLFGKESKGFTKKWKRAVMEKGKEVREKASGREKIWRSV